MLCLQGDVSRTFVLPDHPANLLYTILQLATNSVCHGVDFIKHLALFFKLAAHVICLLAQIAHGPEDAVEVLVLPVHHLELLFLLKGRIRVIVLERVWIWQSIAIGTALSLVLRIVYGVLQLVAHVLDLGSHILDQSSSALHLVNFESEAVWVVFDGFDTFYQILEILAQVLECLFELSPGFS
jgi:hypothetical protein